MLTPERMTELHAAYANDREPGAFERTIRAVWSEAVEAAQVALLAPHTVGKSAAIPESMTIAEWACDIVGAIKNAKETV